MNGKTSHLPRLTQDRLYAMLQSAFYSPGNRPEYRAIYTLLFDCLEDIKKVDAILMFVGYLYYSAAYESYLPVAKLVKDIIGYQQHLLLAEKHPTTIKVPEVPKEWDLIQRMDDGGNEINVWLFGLEQEARRLKELARMAAEDNTQEGAR